MRHEPLPWQGRRPASRRLTSDPAAMPIEASTGDAPSTSMTEFSPPKSAGAALSACPSAFVAAPSSSESSNGPVTRSNTLRAATVAAALLPRPAAIGMSLVTSTVTLGARRPVRWATNSNARSTAFPPDTGGTLRATVSLDPPSSRTSTMRARRYNSTATPSVSKPPPRFATEPGTTISAPTAASGRTVSTVLSDTK